jgi:CMP-N-acetylneuraminic acid synthetase
VGNSKLKIVAIIPARGGSKGIKKKNLQKVGGKPLIVRAIEASKKSKLVSRIVVSTDDSEISKISKEFGVEVFGRGKKISNDKATSESVIIDVLQKLKNNENYIPDITVFIQCTSPFTISEDIDGAIKTLIKNNADSVFVGTEFNHFLWSVSQDNSMVGINHNEKINRKRRQDIQKNYLEAGSVYVFLTNGFIKNKRRFFGKTLMHLISSIRVFEIDSENELKQANLMSLELF